MATVAVPLLMLGTIAWLVVRRCFQSVTSSSDGVPFLVLGIAQLAVGTIYVVDGDVTWQSLFHLVSGVLLVGYCVPEYSRCLASSLNSRPPALP